MRQISTYASLIMLLFLVSLQEVCAQRWNRFKKEVGLSVGASNMMCDLGGGAGDGTRFGDFQFKNSRYALGGFVKYRFHDHMAVKANLYYAVLYGDDKTTENFGRRKRNLDAKTHLIEFSGQFEFYLIKERIGSEFKLEGVKGYGSNNFSLYAFLGLGGAFYAPTGTNAAGEWVRLAPLNTEGQGLVDAPKDYSQLTFVFPMGLGVKYNFNRHFGVQFEYGMRITTSDYLDDASTQYYDGDMLAAAFGEESKQLANKKYNSVGRHKPGGTRGHPDKKDSYMFGLITCTYRIKSRVRSRVRL